MLVTALVEIVAAAKSSAFASSLLQLLTKREITVTTTIRNGTIFLLSS